MGDELDVASQGCPDVGSSSLASSAPAKNEELRLATISDISIIVGALWCHGITDSTGIANIQNFMPATLL